MSAGTGLLEDATVGDAVDDDVNSPRLSTLIAAVALLAIYGLLSLANDPSGYLGTDTGGKVLTLQEMVDRDVWLDVDVGYWAEDWDPDGELHPFYGTKRVGDRWVQVTTVPMVLASRPLFGWGGYRAALVLPMLGGVATALAAQALASLLGADRRQARRAFWLVGLAGPVTIYALDLWEHTLGLAAMAWAVVLLVRARDAGTMRGAVSAALGSGVLWGVAFSMRTEGLLYGAVVTAAVLGEVAWTDRRLARAISTGLAVVGGLGAMVLGNSALERAAIGDAVRVGRASGAGAGAATGIGVRAEETLTTTIGFSGGSFGLLLGLLAVATIAAACWIGQRGRGGEWSDRLPLVLIFAAVPFLLVVGNGPTFITGLFVAAPLAVVGVAVGWNRASRPLWLAALTSIPLVGLVQYVGGAGPQWGGRYLLLSTFLLVVIGTTALPNLRPQVSWVVVGLSILVTAHGLVFMAVRTNGFGGAGRELAHHDSPVLVAAGRNQFLPREFVAETRNKHWLVGAGDVALNQAAQVVRESGHSEFGAVWSAPAPVDLPEIEGFEPVERRLVPLIRGTAMEVVTFRLSED